MRELRNIKKPDDVFLTDAAKIVFAEWLKDGGREALEKKKLRHANVIHRLACAFRVNDLVKKRVEDPKRKPNPNNNRVYVNIDECRGFGHVFLNEKHNPKKTKKVTSKTKDNVKIDNSKDDLDYYKIGINSLWHLNRKNADYALQLEKTKKNLSTLQTQNSSLQSEIKNKNKKIQEMSETIESLRNAYKEHREYKDLFMVADEENQKLIKENENLKMLDEKEDILVQRHHEKYISHDEDQEIVEKPKKSAWGWLRFGS